MTALANRVVVITDANSSVGRAVASRAVSEGARAVANLDEDVSTASGAQRFIGETLKTYGRIDALVNTCQVVRDGALADLSESEWDEVVVGNLRALYLCTHLASQAMRQSRTGCIVNFATDEGLQGAIGRANFVSAQAGIAAFTRVVAHDLGNSGVRVNLIATRRQTHPEDESSAAALAAYLAAEAGARVHGVHFLVDGLTISVLSHPTPDLSLFNRGMWEARDLTRLMPKVGA